VAHVELNKSRFRFFHQSIHRQTLLMNETKKPPFSHHCSEEEKCEMLLALENRCLFVALIALPFLQRLLDTPFFYEGISPVKTVLCSFVNIPYSY